MSIAARSLEQRLNRAGWLFTAPALAVLATVGLYPLIQTFILSLTDARLASNAPVRFVGLENYATLIRDVAFRASVWTTIVFTAVSVTLEMFLGLGIALLLNSKFRGRGLVRAAILVPWALPTVVSAKIWNFMLVDTYGVVNDLLVTRLGILDRKVAWLAEPGLALASVIATDVWKTTPFVALMLLAGLQLIPRGVYEASAVDGAGPRQQFFSVTLPLLMPIIAVTLIFRTLDALRVFDAIWVLTRGQSGTESMATYTFRQLIDFRKSGYGSAASVAIFLLIAVFVVVYMRLLGRRSGENE